MRPEFKYDLMAAAGLFLTKAIHKLKLSGNECPPASDRKEPVMGLLAAVDDACEFYGISREDLFENARKWAAAEEQLFGSAGDIKGFYGSWRGERAIENVCANIMNQMSFFENYDVCARYAGKAGVVVDYGCGTGSLLLSLALNRRIIGELVLLDVPNDVRKFVEFRISKRGFSNVRAGNVLEPGKDLTADTLICLDVLEHLENPSEVLIEKMFPLIRKGGYMVLKAPWRGQLTHIDKAPDDFYAKGGRKFLSKNFKEVYRFGARDICAVYQKAAR